jgi:hypothetical protein
MALGFISLIIDVALKSELPLSTSYLSNLRETFSLSKFGRWEGHGYKMEQRRKEH